MWKTQLRTIPSMFLVANSISWFSLTLTIIMQLIGTTSVNNILLVSGSYFGSLIISAIIGASLLRRKLREKKFLLAWILSGAISCLLFYFFNLESSILTLTVLSLVLGSSIGLGIPTCLSLFADLTDISKRGRFAAVMFFAIQTLTALILLPISGADTQQQFAVLSAWRFLGVAGMLFYASPMEIIEKRKSSFVSIIRERRFILYFLPWLLFTLVNFTEAPILERYIGSQLFDSYMLITFVISSFSAFIGGFICDLKGRKAAGILGFVLLGLGYAFLSFLTDASGRQLAQILYLVFDGTAWGILYVTFIFVAWGDLSEGISREKYYFLGGLPFLFSGLVEVLIEPFAQYIPISTSFSLATFFLFMAILPLLYAPESLPEKVMKDRDLSSYVNKAMQKVQKETGKSKKKENEKKKDSEAEQTPEDEEAAKLAEKYY